jgi:hypothetical protein
MTRQDKKGRAFAGSQLHLQIYVNRRGAEISRIVLSGLLPKAPVGATIHWVAPLESANFAEYCDIDFLRVLGLDKFEKQLVAFWPTRGPHWDGLAVLRNGQTDWGYLIVEAKSYVDEMKSNCTASSGVSLAKIDAALAKTKTWLGVRQDIDWKRDLYQAANRLAHLYFLRQVVGVEAWLVNLCFMDDCHRRTSAAEWMAGLGAAKLRLGLPATIPWVSDVLVPARNREELFDLQFPGSAAWQE